MENIELEIEIKIIKVQDVSLCDKLNRDPEAARSIANFISANSELLKYFYLPIVFKENGHSYKLIARHWAYSYYVDCLVTELPCRVVRDKDCIEKIIDFDARETDMLLRYLTDRAIKKPSRATETRHRAISCGQICPFCSGPLRRSMEKGTTTGVGIKIACENKSNRKINQGKGCDFEAVLSKEEIKLFSEYKLPTHVWLRLIEGKKCPVCGDQIFFRTVHKVNNHDFYERCKGCYRKENKCTHKKKVEVTVS
ncbi:MAG: hypothetical protein KKD69_01075 [Euryarchaeota archaeon]|nr:hypothetical protein [Euryarchaeota archaeon]